MRKGDIIFVYGTLRKGERADLAKQSGSFGVCFLGNDTIGGKMYHLGAYPGVKDAADYDAGKPTVEGEVFLIVDASIIAVMDAYEGYPHLYDRKQVLAKSARNVWVYVYNHPTTSEQLIMSGDWVKNREPVVRNRPLERS